MRRAARLLAAWLACLAAVPALADEVPARNQAVLMLRVLLYDRALGQRVGGVARVVVVSNPADDASRAAGEAMLVTLKDLSASAVLGGRRITAEGATPETLASVARGAAAVYVAPGTPLSSVAGVAQKAQVLTFAAERKAVADGACAGFTARNGRTVILVNLAASKAHGADFESGFLSIAEVL